MEPSNQSNDGHLNLGRLVNRPPSGWLDEPTLVSATASTPTTTAFHLTVKEGPNVGATAVVDDGSCPIFAGTSEVCALALTDHQASRRHVRFEVHNGQLRVSDVGSTNGTFVNGIRTVEAFLTGGETVRVGATVISVIRALNAATTPLPLETSFGSFIGASVAIRRLYPLCKKLVDAQVPLVIEGETGTGKEALAEAIHRAGPRADKPFVVFDCASVPPSLLEGALFGHEQGAYAGANLSRPGIFEEADGGTLFIDEIGDLDPGLQLRLLRAIQSSEVRRIGGHRWQKVDVRIIVATRRDLDVEVAEGRFRDDLFFRLAVGRLALPPLRERPEDIELLARHFWSTNAATDGRPFPEDVLGRLRSYAWPGNVRELSNTMTRLATYGELATSEDGELFIRRSSSAPPPPNAVDFLDDVVTQNLTFASARDRVMFEFERRYMLHLDRTHGDERARSAASGVSDRYLRTLRVRGRVKEARKELEDRHA
ncbi:Response regulator of zinc sigma-54-dependent two-component system [Labilithrix luteola]|uniref:Response regulator of zinc sigma-54-dependent two-component system n=1 Tax=Labilithrix luteola TaxID=1391654 RepID=A0A0K1PVH6_9BACT|nr:sigma 54-interacting transcriptional regulator [Labilithrix luteola]AKU97129.1 Response regulator of zinc sigma-54-dependent two-component system [Labilithrix luteola]